MQAHAERRLDTPPDTPLQATMWTPPAPWESETGAPREDAGQALPDTDAREGTLRRVAEGVRAVRRFAVRSPLLAAGMGLGLSLAVAEAVRRKLRR